MIPSLTVIIWYSQLTTSDEPLGETLTLTLAEAKFTKLTWVLRSDFVF